MMVIVVAHGGFSVSPSHLQPVFDYFFPLFFVSFSAIFGWFESVVIGFKVVGCFSGGDRVMGHGGDRV